MHLIKDLHLESVKDSHNLKKTNNLIKNGKGSNRRTSTEEIQKYMERGSTLLTTREPEVTK
jgi:hypothetical protein